jgi:hypothetical protein
MNFLPSLFDLGPLAPTDTALGKPEGTARFLAIFRSQGRKELSRSKIPSMPAGEIELKIASPFIF